MSKEKNANPEKKKMSNMKLSGLIIAFSMIVAGIILFILTDRAKTLEAVFVAIALAANGVYRLISYFSTETEKRNSWILSDGIITAILGLLLLLSTFESSIKSTFNMVDGGEIALLVGFYQMFMGINQLCSIGVTKAAGRSVKWLFFMGLVNVICSFIIITFPILEIVTLTGAMAFYLLVLGVINLLSVLDD